MIVQQSPPDSAIARALDPESSRWGLQEHLLAGIFDALAVLAWQNTKDGQEGRHAPTPLPRPGVEPQTTTYGNGAMTQEQAEAWLRSRNPLQHSG